MPVLSVLHVELGAITSRLALLGVHSVICCLLPTNDRLHVMLLEEGFVDVGYRPGDETIGHPAPWPLFEKRLLLS